MTSVSGDVNASKLKFSVDSILGNNDTSSSNHVPEPQSQEPPCAGCVAALYRCCRDEPPLLQLQLPLPYAHLHPALRPTSGKLFCIDVGYGMAKSDVQTLNLSQYFY